MIDKQSNLKMKFSTMAFKELNNGQRLSKRQRIINQAKKYGPLKNINDLKSKDPLLSLQKELKQKYLIVENLKRNETGFDNIVQIPNKCVVDLGKPESILQNYLYSRQVSANELAQHISIKEREVYRFVDAKRNILKDDYIIAGRLGDALGTSTKLWLDIQYYLRLKTYLERKPYMIKYFDLNTVRDKIGMTDMNAVASISSPPPGQILNDLYIKPSRIVLEHWSHYFYRDRHSLVKIFKGKFKMNFDFIALIVKAFDVPASYWIDLQNEYLAGKYARMKLENRTNPIFLIRSNRFQIVSHMHPGKILLKLFVIPRNLRLREVAEHLRISRSNLNGFTEGKLSVSPKLAIKLGHAFNTTPMYWLDLQMDFDIASIKNNVILD